MCIHDYLPLVARTLDLRLITATFIAAAISNTPSPLWVALPVQFVGATTELIYLTKSGCRCDYRQSGRGRG